MPEPQRIDENESGVLTPIREEQKQEIKPPPLYMCVVLNDDYTTIEFVVQVFQHFFGHQEKAAMQLTMDVHENGRATAGIYAKDVAETKAAIVMNEARKEGHPLRIEIEPQEEDL